VNHTFEVVLSILILILFLYPFLYYNYYLNQNKNQIELFSYYYNYINEKNLRDCLIQENCNLSWIKSYNCTNNKTIELPENYLTFYLIGKEKEYCPTLVVIDSTNSS